MVNGDGERLKGQGALPVGTKNGQTGLTGFCCCCCCCCFKDRSHTIAQNSLT